MDSFEVRGHAHDRDRYSFSSARSVALTVTRATLPPPLSSGRRRLVLSRGWRPERVVALLLAVAVVSAAAKGRAQSSAPAAESESTSPKPWGPRLEYRTAPGCLDEESFRHAVAIFFKGADPFDEDAADVVRVTFKKTAGGYRGTVQNVPATGDPWPEEDSTGRTCAEVFRDVARLASMRVPEPPKGAPAPPPPVEPPPEPPPPPTDPVGSQEPLVAPAPDKHPRPTPQEKPPMDLAITLSTAVLMTAGFTADVGPGVQVSAGLRRDWFSLALEVRGVLPSKAYMRAPVDPTKPSYERVFDLSQLTGQLVPCVHFATYFAGCGVAQAGVLITQTPVETHLLRSFGFGPRLAFEYPFAERFAAFAFGEALFPPGTVGIEIVEQGPNGEPAPNVAFGTNRWSLASSAPAFRCSSNSVWGSYAWIALQEPRCRARSCGGSDRLRWWP